MFNELGCPGHGSQTINGKQRVYFIKKLIIEIGEKKIKKKKVSFQFTDIPSGKYGIRCFLNEDGNQKLNKGIFGPAEPWGMSWQGEKASGWPPQLEKR